MYTFWGSDNRFLHLPIREETKRNTKNPLSGMKRLEPEATNLDSHEKQAVCLDRILEPPQGIINPPISIKDSDGSIEELIRLPSPPEALEYLDSKTRWLFVHYLTQVSPYIIVLDDDGNGFRNHVLPYAVQDPIVRRAICVTAAFHLADKVPSLRADAEFGRSIIIRTLQNIAVENRERKDIFAETSWVCLILLFIGDLLTGSEDIYAMRRTLLSFRVARRKEKMKRTPFVDFLEYQSSLIEFVARPLSSPEDDPEDNFELDFSRYQTKAPILLYLKSYNTSFKNTRRIYHLRAQKWPRTLDQEKELESLINELKTVLMNIEPNFPGSHCPLWPYFVAGAESRTAIERVFFYTRLETIWLTTRSRNPFVAMHGLKYLWNLGEGVNWVDMISDLNR